MDHTISIAWPVVPLLLYVGAVVALIWTIWWCARGPRALKEPVCGKCRYPVRGLAALTCPECGSDLREVGILSPRGAFGRTGLIIGVGAWTALLPVLAFPPVVALSEALERTTFTATHGYTPKSGAYRRVELVFRGPGAWNDDPPARRVDITFEGSKGDLAPIAINGSHLARPEGTEPMPDRFGFARALNGLGVNAANPAIESEIRNLELLVVAGAAGVRASALLAPEALIQAGVSTITSTTPPPWFGGAVMIGAVGVWMIGVVVFVRARRRRMIALGLRPPARRRRTRNAAETTSAPQAGAAPSATG